MVFAKWFRGLNADVGQILDSVFTHELNMPEHAVADEHDATALYVVVYDDDTAAATGRLILEGSRFVISRVCVLKGFRGKKLGDLAVRMLVRKAFDMGMNEQYAKTLPEAREFFEKLGFVVTEEGRAVVEMKHIGDINPACG